MPAKRMIEEYFYSVPNQENLINKEYKVSQNEVENMVQIIRNWLRQQPHIPDNPHEDYDTIVKFILRCNKMSIEKTKQNLDMFYAFPNFYPEICLEKYPMHPRIKQAMDNVAVFPIRKPMDAFTRIVVAKLLNTNYEKFDLKDAVCVTINMQQLRMKYDKCINECIIIDVKGASIGHALAMNPMILAMALQVYQKINTDRIMGIHFLNVPTFIISVINKLKTFLVEKIRNRVHIHENLESVYEYVSQDSLPEDYGGKEINSAELNEVWKNYVMQHNDFFVKQETLISNEKLRPGKPLFSKNEIFGVEGSFRKLDLD